jgi:hypothetical protein
VYARLQSSPQDQRLEKVRRWICTKNGGRATPRELVRSGVAGIGKTNEARVILQDLYDHGHGIFENGVYILGVPR